MSRGLRIALIASARNPIHEPFAGGLESHVYSLAHALAERGHQVALYAAPGSDPIAGVTMRALDRPRLSRPALHDASMTTEEQVYDHYAYLRLMIELSDRASAPAYDVVHNHSLHYLPVAMAEASRVPVLTTLHTPPTPWMECALQARAHQAGSFVAVSEHTARAWRHVIPDATVIRNGIDLARFPSGHGGQAAVWSGRITPEKGPHLALRAARLAGLPLRIVGPISHHEYYESEVQPLLDDQRRYLGHLSHRDLAELLGSASCALVTPVWEEPYGLVVVEALACGTPVCAFSRGAIPELVDDRSGVLVDGDDVRALAAAMPRAATLSRASARARAERIASREVMIARYEQLYRELVRRAGERPARGDSATVAA